MGSVAVTYLSTSIQLNSFEIGIFFLVTLLATLPGTQLGAYITKKTNPNKSWFWSMIYLFVDLAIGALVLEVVPHDLKMVSLVWAAFTGLGLGWFYPTENLYFSMCLPQGQEAEY